MRRLTGPPTLGSLIHLTHHIMCARKERRLGAGCRTSNHAVMRDSTKTNVGNSVQVLVRDNNIDQAMRVLKKKMQREGIFRELKRRKSYEKPSERRAREKAEAVRRARKLARKQAQREGLLPAPKKVERPRFGAGAARPPAPSFR